MNHLNGRTCAIVVTYNRKELLAECLNALLEQSQPLDEIVLIDNASTDGTKEFLQKKGYLNKSKITYTRLTENTGGAGGFNEGMKIGYEKGYDWLWLMDDDSIPHPDAFENLLKNKTLQDDQIYALTSAVLYPDGDVCTINGFFNFKNFFWQPANTQYYSEKEYFEVDTATFVGFLVRRHTIERIGFPIKEFFIRYDDTEYCLRIRKNGGKIIVVPGSRIVHRIEKPAPQKIFFGEFFSWKEYYDLRNKLYTYRKYKHPRFLFYIKVLARLIKSQIRILFTRRQIIQNSKNLWLAILHGLKSQLGKTLLPLKN